MGAVMPEMHIHSSGIASHVFSESTAKFSFRNGKQCILLRKVSDIIS